MARVRYGAGRGGFSLARPQPYNVPGGYFGGDSRPAPVLGKSLHIPYMAPDFSPLVLTGTSVGNRQGPGHGQETLKKHTPPGAVQRGGAGN